MLAWLLIATVETEKNLSTQEDWQKIQALGNSLNVLG